ncbi:MAG: hypothetical protein LKE98_12070 [Lachnospiraceae bacterium]|nr:hypothetical protein [Lachnospiraceae bacterium]
MRSRCEAPMLQFVRPASAGLTNEYLAEAKSADAVLPNTQPVRSTDAAVCKACLTTSLRIRVYGL